MRRALGVAITLASGTLLAGCAGDCAAPNPAVPKPVTADCGGPGVYYENHLYETCYQYSGATCCHDKDGAWGPDLAVCQSMPGGLVTGAQ